MSYYVEQTKELRRVFRVAHFPYCVYEGTPEQYPFVRVVQVTDTLWGARRVIEKDKRRKREAVPRKIVERVA